MVWDEDQLQNAETIIKVGIDVGASRRDIRIALMTAMQESSLHNYSGGDLDSVGLFQQRDAWGTFEQRHDPAEAARMFFEGGHAGQRGLFDFSDRDSMTLSEAAQSVQVSAYPDAYAKWHDEAADIVRTSPLIDAAGPGLAAGGAAASDPSGSSTDAGDPFAADSGHSVSAKDSDHDGLTDEFERMLGTNVHVADTDHDGRTDLQETTVDHTDPLVANAQHEEDDAAHSSLSASHTGHAAIPKAALEAGFGGGGTIDTDHDGLSDLTEAQLGSDWTQADSDHDGVSDGIEQRLGSDLTNIDSDHDGIVDLQELHDGTLAGLDPADTADAADAAGH